jgi:hypothetical protein
MYRGCSMKPACNAGCVASGLLCRALRQACQSRVLHPNLRYLVNLKPLSVKRPLLLPLLRCPLSPADGVLC